MSDGKIALAIAVMAAVTAAIRFAPFVLLKGRETPKTVTYLGRCLPYAIMGMLVVYCLKDVSLAAPGRWLPQLISGAVVAVSYVLKRSTLLSILLGTLCCMLLTQLVFPI